MKILVLGGNSYVGYHLAEALSEVHQVITLARQPIPSTKWESRRGDSLMTEMVLDLIDRQEIDWVINCICMGNVDQCEKNPEQANSINVSHVERLVDGLITRSCRLLHFSSNAVYCGDFPAYDEQATMKPKNQYGLSKSLADRYIGTHLRPEQFLIVRVMTLYGPTQEFHRENPATFIIKRLMSGQSVKLVDDVFSNVLFLFDLIKFVSLAIAQNLMGTYNLAGDEVVNRHELGLRICSVLGLDQKLISPCESSAFPSLAPRAPNTSFETKKILATAGFELTPLIQGLRKTAEGLQI